MLRPTRPRPYSQGQQDFHATSTLREKAKQLIEESSAQYGAAVLAILGGLFPCYPRLELSRGPSQAYRG